MNILQIVPKFHSSVASGSTYMAYLISNGLAKRGHSVTVYTSNMKDKYTVVNDELEESLVDVKRFRAYGALLTREFKFFITPRIFEKLENNIKDFDIVHLHEYISFQNLAAYYFAQKNSIPYVCQAHGSLSNLGKRKTVKTIYEKLFGQSLLRNASKVFALNDSEVNDYLTRNVSNCKIQLIPNGIDVNKYSIIPKRTGLREKFSIPHGKKIILYLGRIHETKGINLLIETYTYLLNKMRLDDSVLVIAGPDDGYLQTIKCQSYCANIQDSIVFTGFIDENDKLNLLMASKVLVIPSFSGFPVTFLEACLAGTPIVTTNKGDVLNWIDGNVGFSVLPTVQHLANAIYSIVTNDELFEKFSKNGKTIVNKNFTLDKVIDMIEKIYFQILQFKQ